MPPGVEGEKWLQRKVMSRLWLTTKVILKHLATASQVTASNRARQTASILTPPGHVVSLREDCTKLCKKQWFCHSPFINRRQRLQSFNLRGLPVIDHSPVKQHRHISIEISSFAWDLLRLLAPIRPLHIAPSLTFFFRWIMMSNVAYKTYTWSIKIFMHLLCLTDYWRYSNHC